MNFSRFYKPRFGLLFLLVLIVILVCSGCTTSPEPAQTPEVLLEPTATEEPTLKPAATKVPTSEPTPTEVVPLTHHQAVLFIDGNGLESYYNRIAWEAVLAVTDDYNMVAELVVCDDMDSVGAKFNEMIEQGYDIIITNGFLFGDATVEIAEASPEVLFIGIDQLEGEIPYPNLLTVGFDTWDAGFKAGALAAMITKSGVVWGAHGLEDIPAVAAYRDGYAAGVAYIDPNIILVNYYYDGGGNPFDDPGWGELQAERAIHEEADVIFGAGGITSVAMLQKVAENDDVYCIGVDKDMWEEFPELHSCLVSSAIKQVDAVIDKFLRFAIEDQFLSGHTKGSGGLAPFHDFDPLITDEMRNMLAEIQIKMYTGEIQP